MTMTLKDLVPRHWGKKRLPIRREDGNPFSLLQKEVDDLFNRFTRDWGLPSSWREPFALLEGASGDWSPSVDVSETDKEIKVTADLPGMDEKDVIVSVNGGTLTISGEKKSEREEKEKNHYRLERSYGSFYRSIPLPSEVDAAKAEAAFKKGVLTVRLPKTAEARSKTKKITVTAG
jgi:HSP20 family protein